MENHDIPINVCGCGVTLLYTDRHLNCRATPMGSPKYHQMTVCNRVHRGSGCPWHIEMANDVTVLELAMVMSRFGCNAQIEDNAVILVPRNFDSRCPTNREIAALLSAGPAILDKPRTVLTASPWIRAI